MNAPAKLKLVQAPTRWNHQKFATLADPVHKSDMAKLVGDYACLKSFKLARDAMARGEYAEHTAGKSATGTAGHETVARALRSPGVRSALLEGRVAFTPGSVRRVLNDEYQKAIAGKEVRWYDDDEDDTLDAIEAQVEGLLRDIHNHVAAVELIEAGFIAPLGDYWIEGHIDLAFRPKSNPDAWAITDWKTGKRVPHPVILDHGFESGFYSAGLKQGICVPPELVTEWKGLACDDRAIPLDAFEVPLLVHARDDRDAMHVVLRALARMKEAGRELPEGVVEPGVFPEVIRLTMLQEYLPYQKSGDKVAKRAEDIEHWTRLSSNGALMVQPDEKTKGGKDRKPQQVFDPETKKVHYFKGMQRGPAWYRVQRKQEDIARLENLLRGVVGWVRMGKFPENGIGDKCDRCQFRGPCLTDGYQARGDAAKELADALKDIDVTGLADND